MKQAFSFLVAAACAVGLLAAAGPAMSGEAKPVTLVLSTVDGSSYHLPFWIAEQKGQLKAAGIQVEYLGFDGGPIQMEAYESWDLGTTGIGGAVAGTVGHDGVILGACFTDSSTQNFFAKPDSAIVKAGQGKNSISDQVYGDAETWKKAEILSGYGDVKHYCLVKTLEGFGLTIDDVNVLWMDPSSCITSFFSGQGDAVAVYGSMTYNDNVKKLVRVIDGTSMKLGLMSYIVANANSLKDPVKLEALKKILKLYYENLAWIDNNKEEAKPYLESYYKHIGFRYSDEIATQYFTSNRYYLLKDNIEELFAKSPEGDYNVLQADTVNIIRFYQKYSVYEQGTDEKFLEPKHFNFDLLKEIYNNGK